MVRLSCYHAHMTPPTGKHWKWDAERTTKIRIAVNSLIKAGHIGKDKRGGAQMRLAEHFGVSRQRISQIVSQELARAAKFDSDANDAGTLPPSA